MFPELRDLQNDTVMGLATPVAAKDPYTATDGPAVLQHHERPEARWLLLSSLISRGGYDPGGSGRG